MLPDIADGLQTASRRFSGSSAGLQTDSMTDSNDVILDSSDFPVCSDASGITVTAPAASATVKDEKKGCCHINCCVVDGGDEPACSEL